MFYSITPILMQAEQYLVQATYDMLSSLSPFAARKAREDAMEVEREICNTGRVSARSLDILIDDCRFAQLVDPEISAAETQAVEQDVAIAAAAKSAKRSSAENGKFGVAQLSGEALAMVKQMGRELLAGLAPGYGNLQHASAGQLCTPGVSPGMIVLNKPRIVQATAIALPA